MRGSPLGLLDTNALRATTEGAAVGMVTGRRRRWFIRRRGPAGGRGNTAGGARGSHAISSSVTGSGDVALWTEVAAAVELIMAHPVAMKAGRPVVYVIVRERFIVLGQGQVRGVRGAWVVRDVEGGQERRALRSEVV